MKLSNLQLDNQGIHTNLLTCFTQKYSNAEEKAEQSCGYCNFYNKSIKLHQSCKKQRSALRKKKKQIMEIGVDLNDRSKYCINIARMANAVQVNPVTKVSMTGRKI